MCSRHDIQIIYIVIIQIAVREMAMGEDEPTADARAHPAVKVTGLSTQ